MPQGPAAIPIGVPTGWLPIESDSVMDVHVNAIIVGVLSAIVPSQNAVSSSLGRLGLIQSAFRQKRSKSGVSR